MKAKRRSHSSLNEFSLIEKYFNHQAISRADVLLGIGDDAALLSAPPTSSLVMTMDTLAAGVHFPLKTPAFDIGYKALAVNLSDLAAMGAEPAWMMLALTMPNAEPNWLKSFSKGLLSLAEPYNLQLIGGDTTKGPLSITIQANGFVPPLLALRRQGAQVGDKIYVSGTLGDAGLGLRVAQGKCQLPQKAKKYVLERLHRPTPRIKLGMLLRGIASSAIDISDGLLADLGHILESSHVGAEIQVKNLPISSVLNQYLSPKAAAMLALTAGDDYELCFTVPPSLENQLLKKLKNAKIICHCIGEIKKKLGIKLLGFSGKLPQHGYQHFS